MIYGSLLTPSQLLSLSTDIITGGIVGTFSYSALNSSTSTTTSGLVVGSTLPAIGTYTLSAVLNVTNTNYAAYPIITITKTLTVIKSNLVATWYNPVSISHTTPLSSTQLNAVCNSSSATGTYDPIASTTLSTGSNTLLVTFNVSDSGYTYNSVGSNVKINIT